MNKGGASRNLAGQYRTPFGFNVSGVLRYRSGLPYSARYGRDLNGDRFVEDLVPGTKANSLRGESFSQFDLRLSKDFRFTQALGIELIAEVFNVFNETNPAAFNGQRFSGRDAAGNDIANPLFRKPTTYAGDPLQGEQRLLQLGARFRF